MSFSKKLCSTCSQSLIGRKSCGWRSGNPLGQWFPTSQVPAVEGAVFLGQGSYQKSRIRPFSQLVVVEPSFSRMGGPMALSTVRSDHSIIIRSFSSRRSNSKDSKAIDALVNEDLIAELRKLFPNAQGPEDMEVRLVIDEGPDQPATVKVCSLAEGIEISLERMTDLIGISLKNSPPVIRAARLSKLEYEQREKQAQNKKASAKSKQKKTFRFRAGIDTADLNRKIQDMTKFLESGIECEYTVFSKARTLRENASAGQELVEQIQQLLAHCAVPKKAPQENEVGNHIRGILMPKKSK